jgi:hypothetical protein
MKTLQEYKEEFLKKAREYDLGKSEEDFHTYMRQNNLEHHLSETQIQDRNRENNSLNSLGLVAGIAIPLTFGAIFGMNRLFPRPEMNYDVADEMMGIQRNYALPQGIFRENVIDTGSLSGTNTRPMPRADGHINQDLGNLGNLQREIISNVRSQNFLNQRLGSVLFPPTEL